MKVISIIAAFFLIPGLIGASFALLAIVGELANPEHSFGVKLAYFCGVMFLPSIFLGLGTLLLWAGFKNQRLEAAAKANTRAKPNDNSMA